jgi:predicted nuclease of predicted toxin-antitoxin system
VRVLLDNNLSPRLVPLLEALGWDVAHVGTLGLQAAPDADVLDAAQRDGRVLISADTDFGQILARSRAASPSVVLVRRVLDRRAEALAEVLASNLPALADELANGCVVAIADDAVRIRRLPIG